MTGKEIRFSKLLGEGMNAVIVALDHGAQFGPLEGLTDFATTLRKLEAADGILMNPRMLRHCGTFFAAQDAPKMILRLTWTAAYCMPWNYQEAHTCKVMSPQEALYHGADFAMAACLVGSGIESVDRDNVRLFSEIVGEAERAGIPLVGELYPTRAEDLSEAELHETVCRGCRMIAELGADAIKTFYTGEQFAEVVEAVPVPILVLGASKKAEEKEALEMARRATRSGARGVVFGRNVFQAQHPAGFLKALAKAVHEVQPSEAGAQ